jgi:putative ABC transport system ATP-binding protein
LMGGLDRPTSGDILLEGEDVTGMDDARLARLRNRVLGFVFQNFFLLNYFSALENVCLPMVYGNGAQGGLERARRLLEHFGLAKRMNHRPNELSGGEKQRVAIARALVNNPKIIFADEPTGALDTKTGDAIMDTFQEINRAGTSIVLITHDPKVAGRAQRIVHMSDGAIVQP